MYYIGLSSTGLSYVDCSFILSQDIIKLDSLIGKIGKVHTVGGYFQA